MCKIKTFSMCNCSHISVIPVTTSDIIMSIDTFFYLIVIVHVWMVINLVVLVKITLISDEKLRSNFC